jgi:hypothetical protein
MLGHLVAIVIERSSRAMMVHGMVPYSPLGPLRINMVGEHHLNDEVGAGVHSLSRNRGAERVQMRQAVQNSINIDGRVLNWNSHADCISARMTIAIVRLCYFLIQPENLSKAMFFLVPSVAQRRLPLSQKRKGDLSIALC